MTFSCDININAPVNEVVTIFKNPDHLKYYQDGFISKQLISGEEGTVGAVSNMVYKKLELKETILISDLPDEFMARYEHKHMTNTMKVMFPPISDQKTRYTSEIDYTKFNGLFIKLIARLFPGMFKKQVYKWMTQFKDYIESLKT